MKISDTQKISVILGISRKRMRNLNILKNGESIHEGSQMVMDIAMDMIQSRAHREIGSHVAEEILSHKILNRETAQIFH